MFFVKKGLWGVTYFESFEQVFLNRTVCFYLVFSFRGLSSSIYYLDFRIENDYDLSTSHLYPLLPHLQGWAGIVTFHFSEPCHKPRPVGTIKLMVTTLLLAQPYTTENLTGLSVPML